MYLTMVGDTEHKVRPVPFYNWLEQRDVLPQSTNSRSILKNLLEW
ncbi:hypothetical protein [Lysinibacillus sphaericus]|nr:hypothetical protein [Lysinibacillus sphaericus]